MGVNALVYKQAIPDDSVVTVRGEAVVVQPRIKQKCMAQRLFNIPI